MERQNPKGMQRFITLNNVPLVQVSRFKYLGSWITEDARSDEDIRARVGMAKADLWQKKLMRRNIRLSTKMKILNCYNNSNNILFNFPFVKTQKDYFFTDNQSNAINTIIQSKYT